MFALAFVGVRSSAIGQEGRKLPKGESSLRVRNEII